MYHALRDTPSRVNAVFKLLHLSKSTVLGSKQGHRKLRPWKDLVDICWKHGLLRQRRALASRYHRAQWKDITRSAIPRQVRYIVYWPLTEKDEGRRRHEEHGLTVPELVAENVGNVVPLLRPQHGFVLPLLVGPLRSAKKNIKTTTTIIRHNIRDILICMWLTAYEEHGHINY